MDQEPDTQKAQKNFSKFIALTNRGGRIQIQTHGST